uniref:Uncharacterized protein n=1 Tax=Rhizophora mucronata TaxID=61149 RepID=A0A2P2J295_RHIMU
MIMNNNQSSKIILKARTRM